MVKRNFPNELAAKAASFKALNLKKLDNPEWSDVAQRSMVANNVLKIYDRTNALLPDDRPIQKAFDAFALSDANPHHWRKLIEIFAELHYGREPKKTGPKSKSKWTADRKRQLAAHFVETIQEMRRQGAAPPGALENVASIMKKADQAKSKGQRSYADTTVRQMYQQLRTFFSRDENSDPQFLTWIAGHLES
jgi:hypothetical protein